MGLPKLCLYLPRARALCGRIFVVPVGFPPALVDDPAIAGELLSPRAWKTAGPADPAGHPQEPARTPRGLCRRPGHHGGRVALRHGGRARPRRPGDPVRRHGELPGSCAPKLTSVMCRPWDPPSPAKRPPAEAADWDPSRYSAVLVGPGWGLTTRRQRWLDALLCPASARSHRRRCDHAPREESRRRGRSTSAAAGSSRRTRASSRGSRGRPGMPCWTTRWATRWRRASRLNAVVVLKGHSTIVAATRRPLLDPRWRKPRPCDGRIGRRAGRAHRRGHRRGPFPAGGCPFRRLAARARGSAGRAAAGAGSSPRTSSPWCPASSGNEAPRPEDQEGRGRLRRHRGPQGQRASPPGPARDPAACSAAPSAERDSRYVLPPARRGHRALHPVPGRAQCGGAPIASSPDGRPPCAARRTRTGSIVGVTFISGAPVAAGSADAPEATGAPFPSRDRGAGVRRRAPGQVSHDAARQSFRGSPRAKKVQAEVSVGNAHATLRIPAP